MARLWKKNPSTPEGKYPIVLRRDGTPLTTPYLVITLTDPAAPGAFRGYADAAEFLGYDQTFVEDMRALAVEAEQLQAAGHIGDPEAPPHRTDDPVVLAWARSLRCPGC